MEEYTNVKAGGQNNANRNMYIALQFSNIHYHKLYSGLFPGNSEQTVSSSVTLSYSKPDLHFFQGGRGRKQGVKIFNSQGVNRLR